MENKIGNPCIFIAELRNCIARKNYKNSFSHCYLNLKTLKD